MYRGVCLCIDTHIYILYTRRHTRTHVYTYIRIYECVCVCVSSLGTQCVKSHQVEHSQNNDDSCCNGGQREPHTRAFHHCLRHDGQPLASGQLLRKQMLHRRNERKLMRLTHSELFNTPESVLQNGSEAHTFPSKSMWLQLCCILTITALAQGQEDMKDRKWGAKGKSGKTSGKFSK